MTRLLTEIRLPSQHHPLLLLQLQMLPLLLQQLSLLLPGTKGQYELLLLLLASKKR